MYSWNVEADVCRQYLYDWQSDCSGFGKRPDVVHVKEGAKVVGRSSVVDAVDVVLGFAVVVGSGVVVVYSDVVGSGSVVVSGVVLGSTGVVVIGFEVVEGSVEDSVVDVTALGQMYEAVPPHCLADQLKIVVPGHFISVATMILSEVNAQL